MCGTGVSDRAPVASKWKIKFRARTNTEMDPRFYFVGSLPIPREAFAQKGEGPMYVTSEGWTVVPYKPPGASSEDRGIILLHMVLTPGKALKEEVFIPDSVLEFTREIQPSLYRRWFSRK
jgi:hypothetical protein